MELYHVSIPAAAHDPYARRYSPKCYSGTREQHIQDFTLWASKNISQQRRHFRTFWMEGPAGVGKFAVIQTCAENLGKK